MKKKLKLFCLGVVILSCTSPQTSNLQEADENERVMNRIILKALNAINENNPEELKSLFGEYVPENMLFNLKPEVNKMYYLLRKYHNNDISKLKWETDNSLDELGRITYVVKIFEGFDSLSGTKGGTLLLNFGPYSIVPVDSLSGIQYNNSLDIAYRGKLQEDNKLLSTDELIKSLDTTLPKELD